MYIALIAYILLWGGMITLYDFDIYIIIGGFLILIGLLIGISKAKNDMYSNDKYARKKKNR